MFRPAQQATALSSLVCQMCSGVDVYSVYGISKSDVCFRDVDVRGAQVCSAYQAIPALQTFLWLFMMRYIVQEMLSHHVYTNLLSS